MTPCRVPGCREKASGWGRLCNRHKSHAKRHGHPEQEGVTKTMLALYVARVERLKARNEANSAWKALEGVWDDVVQEARQEVEAFGRGGAMIRHAVQASREIVRVGQGAAPWEVVRVALAMCLMAASEPRRFRSDDAFRVEMSRRVRALVERQAGIWHDETGKKRRMYREVPQKVAVTIGHRMAVAFGPAGASVYRKEQAEMDQKAAKQAALAEALEELK